MERARKVACQQVDRCDIWQLPLSAPSETYSTPRHGCYTSFLRTLRSGTLSYIFNTLKPSDKFSEVVWGARRRGYTEPDLNEDLGGEGGLFGIKWQGYVALRHPRHKSRSLRFPCRHAIPHRALASAPRAQAWTRHGRSRRWRGSAGCSWRWGTFRPRASSRPAWAARPTSNSLWRSWPRYRVGGVKGWR